MVNEILLLPSRESPSSPETMKPHSLGYAPVTNTRPPPQFWCFSVVNIVNYILGSELFSWQREKSKSGTTKLLLQLLLGHGVARVYSHLIGQSKSLGKPDVM